MPLSVPQTTRRRIHTRSIQVEGFFRDDGLYDIEASLTDVKDQDFPLLSGVRRAGDPVHLMRVRLTLDTEFNIVEAEACLDAVPYAGYCDTIGPAYKKLVGLNLVRGFRRTVGEMFADVRGCTHLSELLLSLPTAAIQASVSVRRSDLETAEKPFPLDHCHALDTTAGAVRRYYPKWYRKPRDGG